MPPAALKKAINAFPGTIGLAVRTFSDKELFINEHKAIAPESIIKLSILVEAFETLNLKQKVKIPRPRVGGYGVLQYLSDDVTLTLHDMVNLMIILSDNVATNLVLSKIDKKKANKRLKGLGLTKTEINQGLCLPKSQAARLKENVTTPYDTLLLLEHIRKQPKMLKILQNQMDKSILRRYLPKGVQSYLKSGEGRWSRHDCGVLKWKGGGAVVVLFSRTKQPIVSLEGLYKVDERLAEIGRLVYGWARHGKHI